MPNRRIFSSFSGKDELPKFSQPDHPADISRPGAELELKLTNPQIFDLNGKRRVKASAMLVYYPSDLRSRKVESENFPFITPLSPIETNDFLWYLEQYYFWPTGTFRDRALQIESKLPSWGQVLYQAITAAPTVKKPLAVWQHLPADKIRYFSVCVTGKPREESDSEALTSFNDAAGALFTLPWELLFDGKGYLFQNKNVIVIRRRLPDGHPQETLKYTLPIRILLISPRPDEKSISYLDHRNVALPLVKAVEGLSDSVKLTILNPPTFSELETTLKQAAAAGEQYTSVHFDGYGVKDQTNGLVALCFETGSTEKIGDRPIELVSSDKLANILNEYHIPLIFMNIRRDPKVEVDLVTAVAVQLLTEKITSVMAFGHNFLANSAMRFFNAFYEQLAYGSRISVAMLSGRKALNGNNTNAKIISLGELKIQDWFIPVLYQGQQDPVLITENSGIEDESHSAQKIHHNLGYLPEPPSHTFLGRSRELLLLDRMLQHHPYIVIRGMGGTGKTTLAVEIARWLSCTGYFTQVAFINLNRYGDAHGILDCLGKQIRPEGEQWSIDLYTDFARALLPVEHTLSNRSTLILLDNMESILPESNQPVSPEIDAIFELLQGLSQAGSRTRLLFVSREPLLAPFDDGEREIVLGNLEPGDAIQLINAVLKEQGLIINPNDSGESMAEIVDLVEAVQCQARALVLLAPEICHQGVRKTIANIREIIIGLEQKHSGEPENYLYACIELLLRRLPPEMREKVFRLGVFQGGADIFLLSHVLGMVTETCEKFTRALIEAGLAEKVGYEYYRFDPALTRYLFGQMDGPEREEAQTLWAEIMEGLVKILYQQLFENTEIAFHLALLELELPNILAWLDWINNKKSPEEIIGIADNVGSIFSSLGYPQVLLKTTRILEAAEQQLGNQWSHSRYLVISNRIDRHLKQGELQAAYETAHQLLQCCLKAGEEVYDDAAYDIAIAYAILGKVLRTTGSAEAALEPLIEARKRFQAMAQNGSIEAEQMFSTTITEMGNCLRDLGRLDKAAATYEDSINLDQKIGNQRGLAVNQIQLGTIRLYQKRHKEALEIFTKALDTFHELKEPGTVAVIWHQIGMVHRETGRYEQAEEAYRQSLAIETQHKNISGEASTLNELGNLYDAMGRLEDAVTYYRQARDIYYKLHDKYNEAHIRSNLADTLINLQQFEEARREILKAIDCIKPFGHSAEPWKAWIILFRLEQKTGNGEAAIEARQMAKQSYLEYRRDGGESQCPGGDCTILVEQAIQTGNIDEAEQALNQFMGTNDEPWVEILIPKLLNILSGEWTPNILEDPELDYDDAAELQLLLERLGDKSSDLGPEVKKLT